MSRQVRTTAGMTTRKAWREITTCAKVTKDHTALTIHVQECNACKPRFDTVRRYFAPPGSRHHSGLAGIVVTRALGEFGA